MKFLVISALVPDTGEFGLSLIKSLRRTGEHEQVAIALALRDTHLIKTNYTSIPIDVVRGRYTDCFVVIGNVPPNSIEPDRSFSGHQREPHAGIADTAANTDAVVRTTARSG